MSLFNTDNVIDEAKLAREAVAALFDHLRKEHVCITLDAFTPGSWAADYLRGLRIQVSVGPVGS